MGSQDDSAKGPIPPHGVIDDFLPAATHRALVDWAIGEQENFVPASIFTGEGGRSSGVDERVRKALKHPGLGPFDAPLRGRLTAALPAIAATLGHRGPLPGSIEFELNAYGDGAHFRPHIDIPVGDNRRSIGASEGEDRLISAVYYFHRVPKRFSGGALRLFRFGANALADPPEADDSVAFEPVDNRLVTFPAWAMHRVDPVACPGGAFEHYRFALNCWFCGEARG